MAELVRGDTRSETVPGKTNGDDPILLTPELRPTSYEGKLKVHRKAELPTSFTIYADQKHDVVFEVSEENVVTIRTKNYPSLVDRVVPWAKKNWTFLSNIFIAIVLSILLADARSDLVSKAPQAPLTLHSLSLKSRKPSKPTEHALRMTSKCSKLALKWS